MRLSLVMSVGMTEEVMATSVLDPTTKPPWSHRAWRRRQLHRKWSSDPQRHRRSKSGRIDDGRLMSVHLADRIWPPSGKAQSRGQR